MIFKASRFSTILSTCTVAGVLLFSPITQATTPLACSADIISLCCGDQGNDDGEKTPIDFPPGDNGNNSGDGDNGNVVGDAGGGGFSTVEKPNGSGVNNSNGSVVKRPGSNSTGSVNASDLSTIEKPNSHTNNGTDGSVIKGPFDSSTGAVTKPTDVDPDTIVFGGDGEIENPSDDTTGGVRRDVKPYILSFVAQVELKDGTSLKGLSTVPANPACTNCVGGLKLSFTDKNKEELYSRTVKAEYCKFQHNVLSCEYTLVEGESVRDTKYLALKGLGGLSLHIKSLSVQFDNDNQVFSHHHTFDNQDVCLYTSASGVEPGETVSTNVEDGRRDYNINSHVWDCDKAGGDYFKAIWQAL